MKSSPNLVAPLIAATIVGPAMQTVSRVYSISPEAVELLLHLAAFTTRNAYTTRAEVIDSLSGEDAQRFATQYGQAFYELQTARLLTLSNNGNGAIRLKQAGHEAIRKLSAAYADESQRVLKLFGIQ